MILDEAHLGIERDIFVDVAWCIVWLGAKDGANFKDALIDPDQRLLVELRALGKIGRFAKVVYLEDVRAAFSRRRDDLWCLYFYKVALVECSPEAGHRCRRNTEDGALAGVTQG